MSTEKCSPSAKTEGLSTTEPSSSQDLRTTKEAQSHTSSSSSVSQQDPRFSPPSEPTAAPPEDATDEDHYLSGLRLHLVIFSISVTILLVALDNAILATAIPTITSRFNSLDDVGWYGSAFLITICACQPIGGKLFAYFSLKWTFVSFLGVFELGSLVCATAPSSVALIVGRAVAGVGACGLFSGSMVIIAWTVRPQLRPVYMALIMAMFSVANIVGPVLGGALTQHVSWRWCFYINLPCGAVSFALLILFFHPPPQKSEIPLKEKFENLDLLGFVLFAPAVVMLLLALTWGGTTYPWKSGKVIGLLCGAGAVLMIFTLWQWRQQDKASIPPAVLKNRTMLFAVPTGFCILGAMQTTLYYVPLWFQVIKDASPTQSGINLFPTVLANLLMSVISSVCVSKLGYLNPYLFLGTALISVGAGLYTTWTVDTKTATWIGYLIIMGAGLGSVLQMPMVSIQSNLLKSQITTATAVLALGQFFGGSLFLTISSNIFRSKLLDNLIEAQYPGNVVAIVEAGASGVRQVVKPEDLHLVLTAYNKAIVTVFNVPLALGLAAFVLSFGIKWKSVKAKKTIPNSDA